MPTYEYRCGKCEHEFEQFQRISDPPLKTCPKCRGRVRRIISAGAGLLFKGSGFYITDYRSESYKSAAKADKSAPSSPSSSSSSSSAAATPAPPAKPAASGKK